MTVGFGWWKLIGIWRNAQPASSSSTCSTAWPSGFHFRENFRNLALLVNHECGPFDSHVLPAVHALLFPHTVSFSDSVIWVRRERERQRILGSELLLRISLLRREILTISALALAMNFLAASHEITQASLVQPGVSDFGKKNNTTRLPRIFFERSAEESRTGWLELDRQLSIRSPWELHWSSACRNCKL